MTMFADDNYVIKCNKHLNVLLKEIKEALETIIKWLKKSGLKVNEEKTEMCLFYRNDIQPVTIAINTKLITSSNSMNLLGVIFDSKLNRQQQVEMATKKSQKAPQAIKLVRPIMTKMELLTNYKIKLFFNIILQCRSLASTFFK